MKNIKVRALTFAVAAMAATSMAPTAAFAAEADVQSGYEESVDDVESGITGDVDLSQDPNWHPDVDEDELGDDEDWHDLTSNPNAGSGNDNDSGSDNDNNAGSDNGNDSGSDLNGNDSNGNENVDMSQDPNWHPDVDEDELGDDEDWHDLTGGTGTNSDTETGTGTGTDVNTGTEDGETQVDLSQDPNWHPDVNEDELGDDEDWHDLTNNPNAKKDAGTDAAVADENADTKDKADADTSTEDQNTKSDEAKSTDTGKSNIDHPQTGDTAPMASVWASIAAGAGLAVMAFRRRKETI